MLSRSHLPLRLLLKGILLASAAFSADTIPGADSHVTQLLARLDQVKRIGAVAISPDGARLAWVLRGKQPTIELADADGQHAHAVDMGAKLAACDKRDITWAPDSHRLAFIADCGHDPANTKAMHNDVYLVNATGANAPHQMAELPGYARALAWTKDGKSLGFLHVPGATRHASAVVAGLSDWQSYYGENRIDQWMIHYFGASLYDDPAPYAKSSAINFVKQAKTPTLILVGDRDEECPAPQSFEYWHAL